MEAETFYLFYEGANPESKDLMNSSSGGNFTKNKASEAREILGRLGGEGVGDIIDRLEKALLSAIEKKNSTASQEKEKSPGQEDNQLQLYYGPPPDGEFQAHANAVGNWNQNNQNTSWNQWKIKEAPLRDNPCFRNQSNQGNSYVPPHQKNATGNNQNFQPNHQGNQGSGNQFNNNLEGQGNYRQNQGSGQNHNQGSSSNQPNYRSQRNLDDMVHDLVNSQQHMQNNMQSNNDVVHKIQDAEQEQKAAMDMLAKQMSQLETSLNKMRGNEGRIPASVKPPDRANISQITLRSGCGYDGPMMKNDENVSPVMSNESLVPNKRNTEIRST
ncbi:probable serine/threonine-protein kinase DDB_G0282963 [Salvia hispanica]|uniref:probable serine/threonine-protein kinase DDB_G0282963 n=1 Tax=Salvia hispanica TaxID=49212 RepID=UPI0020098F01|nr:probable serine/threonine-protein kinase DDB_G0282963 [Salvia hispanica]